jgi:hypothetical protein
MTTDSAATRLRALDAGMRKAPWQYLEGTGSADPEEGDELQDGNGEMVANNFSDDILPRILDGRGCAALRNALPALADLVETAEAHHHAIQWTDPRQSGKCACLRRPCPYLAALAALKAVLP